jgi:lipid-A-disaccharide synthase
MPRIMLVAGEASGDLLGAGLITALKKHYPQAIFEGIAGPQMQAAGCRSLFPLEALSVMGVVEVLKHLPQILSIRYKLLRYLRANPPDIYIGIDAPDFNLPIELRAHRLGVKVVHYVSPSVWAWRQKRVHTIAKAVDLMLTLFPFEADFYHKHNIKAECVGHPLADSIPLIGDKQAARQQLGLPANVPVIALLPGSRSGEIARLGNIFLQAAKQCLSVVPNLRFVSPMVNAAREAQFRQQINMIAPDLPITVVQGHASAVMCAADTILLASGTATLEAMLNKKSMVVAYKLSPLTFALAKRLIKVKHIALPNLLAKQSLVPELLQGDVTPDNLAKHLLQQLHAITADNHLHQVFDDLHNLLKQNANEKAAAAVAKLCR